MEHTIRLERKRNNARLIAGLLALGIIVVLVVFVVIPWLREAQRPADPPYWPTTGWQTSLPEEQGIYSDKFADLLLAIREHDVQIHSLLVVRNGYMVADATFYPYDGRTIHDVASVTKSVMTTLIGIAVDQGKLDLDDKMVSFFPDRTIANLDARKEAITVRHLVSMTSGLQCVRDGREGDSAVAMQDSPDYVQYALDLPVAYEPGTQFIYCSPAISLLSPILQQATGMTTLAFAQQYLFEPLGIHDVLWDTDPQGYYRGWGDLALHPHDMAKLGLLFLQEGRWEDKQIVSRRWVKEASVAQSETPADEQPYGYGWWLTADLEGVYQAEGRNGQYIFVLPQWNMVVVTTGGGFEMDEIGEHLLGTFSGFEEPLPANPEGVARLESALAAVAQPPAAGPVAALPDAAQDVSGKSYVFESNFLGLESVAFDFDGSAEATWHLKIAGRPLASMPIGLDGVYRFEFDVDGHLVAIRGSWTDPQTFVLEYNGVTGNDQLVLRLHFQGELVEVTVSDLYSGTGPIIEGRRLPTTEDAESSGLPNPASVYCEEQGNTLEMREGEGGIYGVCIFPDGSECDEWAYYRGECQPGQFPAALAEDGWQNYHNDAFGYTFHFPPEAIIEPADDPLRSITVRGPMVESDYWPMIFISHPQDNEAYQPTAGVDLAEWLTTNNLIPPQDGEQTAEVRLEDVEIAGLTAVHTRFNRSPQSYAFDKYFFTHDGQLYSIVIIHTGDTEDWELYNHFLESFQFDS